jgi:hypothetical protein
MRAARQRRSHQSRNRSSLRQVNHPLELCYHSYFITLESLQAKKGDGSCVPHSLRKAADECRQSGLNLTTPPLAGVDVGGQIISFKLPCPPSTLDDLLHLTLPLLDVGVRNKSLTCLYNRISSFVGARLENLKRGINKEQGISSLLRYSRRYISYVNINEVLYKKLSFQSPLILSSRIY